MPSMKKIKFPRWTLGKVYLSGGGLKRHVTSSDCLRSDLVVTTEMRLAALTLKGFFKKIICKFAQDECHIDATLHQRHNEQRSFVMSGTVLISLYFFEHGQREQYLQSQIPYHSHSKNLFICDQNSKPSTPPSPIPSISYHYFHTLLIPRNRKLVP